MGKEGEALTTRLQIALPSKGRLMEQTLELFRESGLNVRKTGNERGYRGEIEGFANVDVAFVSASEIAANLKSGKAHLGVTGEDLVRERISDWKTRVELLKPLGFGFADVVVAVPQCWLDVSTMADLDEIAGGFRESHGRWFRVATKYVNLTRRFFSAKGFTDYRIVESLGATEGTPAAGSADLIVDITSTGTTLRANGLKILDDGVILKSQANFVASNVAQWTPSTRQAQNEIMARLEA
ncbi:ATP phosphoribosyltransferase [Candidatus Filomicrobium marinum]|uniref:ATP phosphoribosyltransferase n=2 Tax=Filomicrobium TaxID=119044 RepID=A0A0D6JA21_9HYPH|nr:MULTISPECIES: ATP phosphoribosyltransferase [Filomicrobium]MCV0368733.1 ATP phosphoribosyltransferase [Filomicrobium sp.]CFW99401.1 ATP phosphoribosyltransferase [Candidatus Filomicrobium marinum]CPR15046.1 ATP phosphoribosyltransferase [Candidatus Filomicrobium marinum]SDO71393.1 ATP phosphoribosyltransferase [Filomicrobium insigne]